MPVHTLLYQSAVLPVIGTAGRNRKYSLRRRSREGETTDRYRDNERNRVREKLIDGGGGAGEEEQRLWQRRVSKKAEPDCWNRVP